MGALPFDGSLEDVISPLPTLWERRFSQLIFSTDNASSQSEGKTNKISSIFEIKLFLFSRIKYEETWKENTQKFAAYEKIHNEATNI